MKIEVISVRLKYKRKTLAGAALLSFSMGFLALVIALVPTMSSKGLMRLLVLMLGQNGASLLLVGIGLLAMLGALRLIWLMFDGALAIEVGPRGSSVRSVFYTGVLPWASVASADTQVLGGWGKDAVLVIIRTDNPGLLLHLCGLGSKVVIQPKLLEADYSALQAWIEVARNRGTRRSDQQVMRPNRTFGRRR